MIQLFLTVLAQSTVLLCLGLLIARLPSLSAGVRHLLLASMLGWLTVLPWLPVLTPTAPLYVLPADFLPELGLLSAIEEPPVVTARAVSEGIDEGAAWSLSTWIVLIYGAVLGCLALRYLLDVLRIARLVRRGRAWTSDPRHAPMVQLAEARISPFVWGLWRPRIVVPAGAQRWSAARMDMVLAHEQAHVTRGDVWIALLSRIVCWCYWWHPLVWIARRRLLILAEQACDDAVLARGMSPEGYAQTLIDITKLTRPQVTPAMASTTQLSRRVNALLDDKVRRTNMSIQRILLALALSAMCFLPLSRVSLAATGIPKGLAPAIHASLKSVQSLIAGDELVLARERLDTLSQQADLSVNDAAQIANMQGYVAFLREDHAAAIAHYKTVVADPAGIPAGLRLTTLYTLAQLHFVQEDYPSAINYMHAWAELADNPGPVPLIFIAQTYYQMDDYEAALDYVERGLTEAENRGASVKPNWIKLRDYLRLQTGAVPAETAKPGKDAELMPIVKVQPVYPHAARNAGTEGYVLVEFTVNRNGGVSDPVIVQAEPPGVFDSAALQAVRKFKYKPRLADGVAVDTTGIRNRLTFTLPDQP